MRGLLVLCLFFASFLANAQNAWQLGEPIAVDGLRAGNPAVIAATRVELDWSAARANAERLRMPLPDGSHVWVEHSGSEQRGAHDYTWTGRAANDPEQQIVLTRVGSHASAYLSLKSGIYELTTSAEGGVLLKLDTDLFPGCGGALKPPLDADDSVPARSAGTTPDGSADLMDVLVVFSPGSVTQLGGEAQARTFAQGAVDSSNQAFANSQMGGRFRLAGVRFTSRADSGNSSTDLSWLRSDAQVAGWRNDTGADMVGMIAEFTNACGTGYLMGSPPGPGFAPNAFQVTARSCAIGNLTYAHEHGHNMGLTHNPENGSGPAFAYAFGHYVSGSFRTVMSYLNPCVGGCTRRPYFSNPNVSFSGAPTGIANARDNARAGNNTASIIAAFRGAPLLFSDGFE